MIGEVIYIRVSDRKYNPIATKRGNVPTQSWRGKSKKAVGRQRNLGLVLIMIYKLLREELYPDFEV